MKVSFNWHNPDTSKNGIITIDIPELIVNTNTLLNVSQRQMAYEELANLIGEVNIKYCCINSIETKRRLER